MRPIFVVVSAPFLHLRAGIGKRQEPVCVEAFGAEPSIEGFDERVIGRLSGTGEVQSDAARISP